MTTRLVLAASITANAALAVAVAHGHFSGASRPKLETRHPSGAFFTLEPRKGENSTTPLPSMLPTAFHWRQLESTDYRQYIANLRAIGCPEETVRDLIISEINKLYAPRFAALLQQTNLFGWRHAGDPATATLNEQLRALRREKRDILKELLGVNCYEESQFVSGMLDPRDRMFAFLPAEKREAVRDLLDKYGQLEQQIYWKTHGFLLPEDGDRRKELKAQLRQEAANVFSPAELEQFDLRTSELGNELSKNELRATERR